MRRHRMDYRGINWYLNRDNFYLEEVNPRIDRLVILERIAMLTVAIAVMVTIGVVLLKLSTAIIWTTWIVAAMFALRARKQKLKIRGIIATYYFHKV